MEKATLTVQSNNKGKVNVKLTFSNGKSLPASFLLKDVKEDEINNQEVEVDRPAGTLRKIVWNGKALYDSNAFKVQPPKQQYPDRDQHQGNYNQQNFKGKENAQNEPVREPATAPYNFIPLNDVVIKSDFDIKKEENWFHYCFDIKNKRSLKYFVNKGYSNF